MDLCRQLAWTGDGACGFDGQWHVDITSNHGHAQVSDDASGHDLSLVFDGDDENPYGIDEGSFNRRLSMRKSTFIGKASINGS